MPGGFDRDAAEGNRRGSFEPLASLRALYLLFRCSQRFEQTERQIAVGGVLPSGRAFDDLLGYKQALLAEKERFVRGFTQKMLTYALGRSVGATDREMVDCVVQQLERDQYRMQALLQAVVASEAFRMK